MKRILFFLSLSANAMPAKPPKESNPKPPVLSEFKSLFPKQEWTNWALAAVQDQGLDLLKPLDAKDFCKNGMNAHNWVHLLAAMAKYESGFDPNQTYKESFGVISTGLLQISLVSGNGYGCGFSSTNDIKDPKKNLTCGAKILKKWVSQDKVIAGSNPYRGGSKYWSVLRPSGKLSSVKATLKQWCE